jgi:ribosomal-protein-alanine N-acetyltransferase
MTYLFPIETERLRMRLLTREDVDEWSVFFVDNPQLYFVGVKDEKKSEEHAKFWLDRQIQRYHDYGLGMLGMIEKATGKMIGQVGIIKREIKDEQFFEVGYAVIPSQWGKGFASEGAIRMKQYLVAQKLDNKVISMIHRDNTGSQIVAVRNGMHRSLEIKFQGDPCYAYRLNLD